MSHHHRHHPRVYEKHHEPLAPPHVFRARLLGNAVVAVLILGGSLGLGVVGYRVSGGLSWLDSLYNASMILGGMGPVDARPSVPDAEKWFASGYALFAGVVFLVSFAVLLAPVVHRAIHRFHLADADKAS
jgi:hypothetical protein